MTRKKNSRKQQKKRRRAEEARRARLQEERRSAGVKSPEPQAPAESSEEARPCRPAKEEPAEQLPEEVCREGAEKSCSRELPGEIPAAELCPAELCPGEEESQEEPCQGKPDAKDASAEEAVGQSDFSEEELAEEEIEERHAAGESGMAAKEQTENPAGADAAQSDQGGSENENGEEQGEGPLPETAVRGAAALRKKLCGWRPCKWKLWTRILAAVLAVVLVLGLAGYGYFHSKYSRLNISDGKFSSSEISMENDEEDQLENEELQSRQDAGQLEEQEAVEATGEIWSDSNVFNILLIGTDDRTKEFSDNARGDTCMLLSLNRETNQLHLVSFERAIGVKIPSGDYEGQWDWLTHMFWYGGPYMMTQVIRENFKVDVTKYIRVNIRTFMQLVDSVGGVDIDMTEAECNNINHPEGTYTAGHIKGLHVEDTVQQDLVPGVNHLNGATAMCYARLRAIDDDWHRVERQRKVILAAMQNLKKLSLTDLDALLNEVLPLVQTNLTQLDIASLIPEAETFLNMDCDTITFPLKNTYGLMDGMCSRRVLALDFETNAQELQRFLNGETTAEELENKYEKSNLGDYSYRNSDSYQKNYQDAEAVVGRSTYTQVTGKSKPSLVGTGTASEAGSSAAGTAGSTGSASAGETTAESADGGSAAEEAAAALGEVESTSTDPTTGVVTIIYYNSSTGVRTAVAANTANGATTVTTNDTNSGATSTTYAEGTAAGTSDAAGVAAGTSDAAAGTEDTAAAAGAAPEAVQTEGNP